MNKEVDPGFYERAFQDIGLVDGELNAARRGGRPIDSLFVEDVARKRLEQASGYSLPEGAPGATLETSREVVNAAVFSRLVVDFGPESRQ